LGVEAGDTKAEDVREGLKKMLATVLSGQAKDGSWKLFYEWRPIGSSPDVITTLALLALSDPNAPDLGEQGKTAREKGLKWLQDARPGDDPQTSALRLILWKRL